MALIQENAYEYPAAANGIFMTMNFFLGSLAVMTLGLLSDLIGLESSYWVCTLLSLSGIPCALLLKKD